MMGIIYGRAEQAIDFPWSPLSSSPLSWLLGPAAHLQNSAGWPAPAALGVGALSVLISQSFLEAASPKAIGQSCLSIAGRQPSQGLGQHIPALAPVTPALLPRFNFMFIRSIERDIFSRSKRHSEHKRNTVTGQEQVMWYPHWKTSYFQGRFGGWERAWPGAIFGKGRNLHADSVRSAAWGRVALREWVLQKHTLSGSTEFISPITLLPTHLSYPYCCATRPPRRKRGPKHCPSSVRGRGSQYSWKDKTLKNQWIILTYFIQKCNQPEHRHRQRRTRNYNMCQKNLCPKLKRILGCWQLSIAWSERWLHGYILCKNSWDYTLMICAVTLLYLNLRKIVEKFLPCPRNAIFLFIGKYPMPSLKPVYLVSGKIQTEWMTSFLGLHKMEVIGEWEQQ